MSNNTILKTRMINHLSRKWLLVITLALTVIPAITTRAFRDPDPGDENPPSTTAMTETKPQPIEQRDQKVETELLTIRRTGFHPSRVSRPEGKFLLAVSNRSGAVELNLRLHSVTGVRLVETRVSNKQLYWSGLVTLPAGEYVLTEANHPNWICRITITNG